MKNQDKKNKNHNSNSFEQYYQKGMQFFRKNELENAVENWEKASEINTNNADLHSILGNAYKLLDNFEKSNESLHKAVELAPDNFKYLYNYGLVLNDQGRHEEALNVLIKALDLHPDNIELLNDIGVVNYNLGQFNKAVSYLKESWELNHNYLAAGLNLSYAYIELNQINDVNQILSELKTNFPESIEIRDLENYLETILSHPEKASERLLKLEFSDKTYQIKPFQFIKNFESNVTDKEIDLSIVVPIMNEKDNITILYNQLTSVLKKLKQNYEIIFIDDGSTDGSLEILKTLTYKDNHLKIIQFRKNYGQTAALSAGFKYAHGNVIITMDGDLQNDPEDIPRLLEKMAEGYDLVNGWRKDRQDKNLTRKIPSKMANKLINKLIEGTKIQLNDYGCTLKAYKRGIIKNIHLYGEMHRFIPVFAAWLGVKVAEIPVKHHARIHGKAKYNLSRVPRVIFDLLVVRFFSDYLTRPIQFFGKMARKSFVFFTSVLAIAAVLKIIFPVLFFSFDALLILFGILVATCSQVIIIGLLGEIVMRIYFEGQKKDYFIVEKVIKKS